MEVIGIVFKQISPVFKQPIKFGSFISRHIQARATTNGRSKLAKQDAPCCRGLWAWDGAPANGLLVRLLHNLNMIPLDPVKGLAMGPERCHLQQVLEGHGEPSVTLLVVQLEIVLEIGLIGRDPVVLGRAHAPPQDVARLLPSLHREGPRVDDGEPPVAAQVRALLEALDAVGPLREVVGLVRDHGHLEGELGVAQEEVRHGRAPAGVRSGMERAARSRAAHSRGLMRLAQGGTHHVRRMALASSMRMSRALAFFCIMPKRSTNSRQIWLLDLSMV